MSHLGPAQDDEPGERGSLPYGCCLTAFGISIRNSQYQWHFFFRTGYSQSWDACYKARSAHKSEKPTIVEVNTGHD